MNDTPTSTGVVQSSNEDTQFVFSSGSFPFIDVDSGSVISSGSILSGVTIVSLVSTGILRLSGVAVSTGQFIASGSLGNLTYDPLLNGNGTSYTTFTFRVTDNGGLISAATYTYQFNITPVNDAPVVLSDTGSIAQSGSGFLAVLTNDTDPDTGDTKTISGYTLPSNGSIIQTATGFTYTANAVFCGVDTFTYRIADGSGVLSNTGTVSVTIISCDTTAPLVTLSGAASLTIAQDSAYTDA